MKKITSVFIGISILLSIFVINVSAEEIRLPLDTLLDFESSISVLNMNVSKGDIGIYSTATDGFDITNVYDRNASFSIMHNSSAGNLNMRFNQLSFKSGITYNISFWYKTNGNAWLYFIAPDIKSTTLNSEKWNECSVNVNFSSDINYLEIGTTTPGASIYIDNLSIKEVHNIYAQSNDTSLGTVSVSSTVSSGRAPVIYNAYPEYGSHFFGWKNEQGDIISKSTEYIAENIISDMSLTAVFETKLYSLLSIDFESTVNFNNMNLAKGNIGVYNSKLSGYLPQNVYEGVASFKVEHNSSAGNLNFRFTGYDLKPGGKYKLSFTYKTDKPIWTYFIDPEKFNTTLNSSDWATYSSVITFPSNVSYFEIGQTTPDGTTYFDNIVLSPVYSISAVTSDACMGSVKTSQTEAAEGEYVTFTALPTYGYTFSSWKNQYGKVISTEETYCVSILDDTTLEASFEKTISDDILIDFENNVQITNMNDSAGFFEIVSSDTYSGYKCLKLKSFENKANLNIRFKDISLKKNRNYQISFWYKSSLPAWGYMHNSSDNNLGISFDSFDNWQKITKIISCTDDISYLDFGTVAPNNTLLIDDIEVKEFYRITVSSNNPEYGILLPLNDKYFFGDTVTLNAVPANNYALARYEYGNGQLLSSEADYSFSAKGNLDISAIFERRCNETEHVFFLEELESDRKVYVCENCGYSYTLNDINNDDFVDIRDLVRLKKSISDTKSISECFSADCDENGQLNALDITSLRKILLGVNDLYFETPIEQRRTYDYGYDSYSLVKAHSGTYSFNGSGGSLYIDAEGMQENTNAFSLTEMFVKPFTTYQLSAYVYGVSCKQNIQLNLLNYPECSYISGNTATYSNSWNELSFTFTTGDITNNIITPVLIINTGNRFYFDELSLVEIRYNGSYCEKLYNIVDDGDFEDGVFANNLQNGVSVIKYDSAVSGTNILSINKNTTVEKDYILKNAGKYRFAFSYQSKFPDSFKIILSVGEKTVTLLPESISSGFIRKHIDFTNNTVNSNVKIKITSTEDILIDDIFLFEEKYALEQNPKVYETETVTPITRQAVLKASTDFNLYLNIDDCVQTDYLGNSAVYYAFNYIPEKYDRTYTAQMRQLELNRIKQAGVSVVRTEYSPCWAFDTTTNKWNFNTEEMQGFYSYLSDMKELGIDIAMQIGWNVSDINSQKLDFYGYNPFYILSDGDNSVADELYAVWVAESVKILHEKGFDNVKYLVAFTEPSTALTTEKYTADIVFWKHYVMLAHNSLVDYGIRDSVKILGFNMGAYNRKTSPVDDFLALKYMAQDAELLEAIDIFTYHIYVTSSNNEDNYSEWYSYMSECVRIASSVGKQMWFDEGEWISADNTDWESKISNGLYGTQLAVKTVAAMNSGLQTAMRWTLVDQFWLNHKETGLTGEWVDGCHRDGLLPNLLETSIPRKAYYAYLLIGKYTSSMNNVYSGIGDTGLYITACSDEKGNVTLIVVNTNQSVCDFAVYGLSDFKVDSLRRYTYNPEMPVLEEHSEIMHADMIINNISDKFTDTLPAFGVAVYTTII